MADGANPVGPLDVVLPTGLAHPGLAQLAEGPAVHDAAEFGATSAAGAVGVGGPMEAIVVDVGAAAPHTDRTLLLQHGQFGPETAEIKEEKINFPVLVLRATVSISIYFIFNFRRICRGSKEQTHPRLQFNPNTRSFRPFGNVALLQAFYLYFPTQIRTGLPRTSTLKARGT